MASKRLFSIPFSVQIPRFVGQWAVFEVLRDQLLLNCAQHLVETVTVELKKRRVTLPPLLKLLGRCGLTDGYGYTGGTNPT